MTSSDATPGPPATAGVPTTPAHRTRRGRRARTPRGAGTRAALLASAIDRFGRDGFRATSVTDIARDAGVGPTAPYVWFADKRELFAAALDADAAAVIDECLPVVFAGLGGDSWAEETLVALVAALERHPLARRVLAGLEPDVTPEVMDLPALVRLREVVVDRLAEAVATGEVRAGVDPERVGRGLVAIVLALLMATLQLGPAAVAAQVPDVAAALRAVLR